MTAEPEPRLADLVAGAVRDIQTLISGQVELAKAEIAQSAKRGAQGGGLIGLAIFMALFALLMFAFSAAYGLVNAGLKPWAAFLIVGTVMLLVTALLGLIAYRQFKKITGPVMAQAELAKTTQVFSDRRTAAAATVVAAEDAAKGKAAEPRVDHGLPVLQRRASGALTVPPRTSRRRA